ncbi:hypothetical protein CXG81DRAFT_28605 [Caulochytrium protostelioides]|uniref:F-actin-capping protein subunit beta n=1 Tax=Caulochytrium protostelioides TaxID=1555241 RepID=A0A4P9X2J6_9FUNG|nr:hypothetical protein CXG81DRAFT_28605 [Caulochytrium protostelioides]|eukprot:RKO98576.1 hypothetical protein CXG81DRAFT_28605 [Caulochytrium protostelioides]
MPADPLDCALDLIRRLPPQQVERHVAQLADLAPHLTEELLSAVDQPLKIQRCATSGKDYLLCDYNRDGDAYRSPWSNTYEPALPDGARPSDALRVLEVAANDAFDTYRELYYEGGVSSVYMWDLPEGFAAVVLIKKVGDAAKVAGTWDAIHVLEVRERGQRQAHYKLTSTILLQMVTATPALGQMALGGSLTRQTELDAPLEEPTGHIANMGRMVEEMEAKLRNALQAIYFGKTRDIVNDIRSAKGMTETRQQLRIQAELVGKLQARGA